jgi:hypothetical protein
VSINMFQLVSRVLHAHRLEIITSAYAMLARLSFSTKEYTHRLSEHGASMKKPIAPMIFISTKEEPITLVQLSRIVEMAISYFNDAISKLEDKKIFITRSFRDLS